MRRATVTFAALIAASVASSAQDRVGFVPRFAFEKSGLELRALAIGRAPTSSSRHLEPAGASSWVLDVWFEGPADRREITLPLR